MFKRLFFGVLIFITVCSCTKKKEPVSPEVQLKQDHENLLMNTHIARKAFDLVSQNPGRQICGLDEKGWSAQIKKLVDQRNLLPKLSAEKMDQIDRGMNHFLCDMKCIQEFCDQELKK